MEYVFVIVGFVLLFAGGELLVRGAVGLSNFFKLSPLLVGMTVVAFATSAPELFVSLSSALKGNPGIAIGNVVGSNIANVLLILGATAVILPIVANRPKELRRDFAWTIGASVALAVLSLVHVLTGWMEYTRPEGFLLFAALIVFIVYSYRAEARKSKERRAREGEGAAADAGAGAENVAGADGVALSDDSAEGHSEETEDGVKSPLLAVVFVAIGVVALVGGAELLVRGATTIAQAFGVSDTVIGLTIVAIGTSLPELAACIVAAVRGHSEVAIGNIFGSNLFNILCILGLTSLATTLPLDVAISVFDVWIMLITTTLACALLYFRKKIGRVSGALFVLLYVGYLYVSYTGVSQEFAIALGVA